MAIPNVQRCQIKAVLKVKPNKLLVQDLKNGSVKNSGSKFGFREHSSSFQVPRLLLI